MIQSVKRIARRSAASIVVLIVLFAIALAWRYERHESARNKREAGYELERRRYSAALRMGMSRKELEEYFRENNIVARPRMADELLVQIGREDPPWFCSELNVFVKFQFDHHGRNPSQWPASDSDVLTSITTLYWPDRCL